MNKGFILMLLSWLVMSIAYLICSSDKSNLQKELQQKNAEQQITNQAIQDLNYQVDSLRAITNQIK